MIEFSITLIAKGDELVYIDTLVVDIAIALPGGAIAAGTENITTR